MGYKKPVTGGLNGILRDTKSPSPAASMASYEGKKNPVCIPAYGVLLICAFSQNM